MIRTLLCDPRLFGFCVIVLNLGASVRFAVAGLWWQVAYWSLAAGLNVVATFGLK